MPPLILGVYEPAQTHPVLHVLRHFFLQAGQCTPVNLSDCERSSMAKSGKACPNFVRSSRLRESQRDRGNHETPGARSAPLGRVYPAFRSNSSSASQKRRRKSGASHPYDPVRGALYSTNNIRPQLLQVTVWRPLLTLWRSWVGSDIRQPWQRSRSTLATARPPLDFRNVS